MAERIVLVLDPDHRTAELLSSVLDGEIYTVVRLNDAAAAHSLWRSEPPFALFVASNHPESNDFIVDFPVSDRTVPLFVLGTGPIAPVSPTQPIYELPNPATVGSLAPYLTIFTNNLNLENSEVDLEPDEYEFDDESHHGTDLTQIQTAPLSPPPPPGSARKFPASHQNESAQNSDGEVESLRISAKSIQDELRAAHNELKRLLEDNARIADHSTAVQLERDAVVNRLVAELDDQVAVLARMEQLVQRAYEEHQGAQSELKVIRDLFSGTESELLSIREHHNAQMESFRDEYQGILEQQLETFDREREETESQIEELTRKLEHAYSVEADLRQFLSRSSESQKVALEAFEAATAVADRSERKVTETNAAIAEQIAALEDELAHLREDLENERESSAIAIAALEADLAAAKSRRNLAVAEAQNAAEQAATAASTLARTQANEQKLQHELHSLSQLTASSKAIAQEGGDVVAQLRTTIAQLNATLAQKDDIIAEKCDEIRKLTSELEKKAANKLHPEPQSSAPGHVGGTTDNTAHFDETALVAELKAQRKAALETASRLQERLHNVATEKDAARAKAAEAERQLAQLTDDVAEKVAQYDMLRGRAEEADRQLTEARAVSDHLRHEIDGLQNLLSLQTTEVTTTAEKMAATRKELEQALAEWENATAEAAKLQTALLREQEDAAHLRTEAESLRETLEMTAGERDNLRQQLADSRSAAVEYQGRIDQLHSKIAELEAAALESSQICAELFQDLSNSSSQLAAARQTTHQAEETIQHIRQELEATQDELKVALADLVDAQDRQAQQSAQVSALDSERTLLLEERTSLLAKFADAQEALNSERSTNERLSAAVAHWQTRGTELEAAFEDSTEQLEQLAIRQTVLEDALKAGELQLEQERGLVSTLRQREEHLNQVTHQLNEELLQLTEDLERASELADGLRAEATTFKENAAQANVLMQQVREELAQRSQQLEDARRKSEEMERRAQQKESEREGLATSVRDLQELLQRTQAELTEAQARSAGLQTELLQTTEIVDEAAVVIDKLTAEKSGLQQSLNELESETNQRNADLVAAQQRIRELEAALGDAQNTLTELETKWASDQTLAAELLEQANAQSELQLSELNTQLQAVSKALKEQQHLAETARSQAESLQKALEERAFNASHQQDVAELLRVSLDAAQAEVGEVTAALKENQNRVSHLENTVETLQKRLDEQQEQSQQLAAQLTAEQNAHGATEEQRKAAFAEIANLQFSVSSAEADRQHLLQIQHTEKTALLETVDRLTHELDQVAADREYVKNQLNEATIAKRQVEEDAMRLRAQLAELDRRLTAIHGSNASEQADLIAVRVALDEAIVERDALAETLAEAQSAIRAKHEAVSVLESTVSRLTGQLHQKTKELDNAQLQIDQLGVALTESELAQDTSAAELAAAIEERDKVLGALHDIRIRLEERQQSAAATAADLEAAREQNQQSTNEIEQLRHVIRDLQAQHDSPKTPQTSEKDQQLLVLEQELLRVRKQLVALTAELAEVRDRAGDLEEARTYDAQDLDSLRKALEMARADAAAARDKVETEAHAMPPSGPDTHPEKSDDMFRHMEKLKSEFTTMNARIRRCLMELEQGQQRLTTGRQQLASRRVALRNLAETWRQLEQMMREMAEDDAVRPHIARLATVLREMKVSLRETRSILENSEYLSTAQDELVKKLYTTLTSPSGTLS